MTNAELIKALRYCISDNADDCGLCPYQSDCKRNGTGKDKMIRDAADALEAQLPKEGEWIMDGKYNRHCSRCNDDVVWSFNYCPNCGARMKGTNDERD